MVKFVRRVFEGFLPVETVAVADYLNGDRSQETLEVLTDDAVAITALYEADQPEADGQ